MTAGRPGNEAGAGGAPELLRPLITDAAEWATGTE